MPQYTWQDYPSGESLILTIRAKIFENGKNTPLRAVEQYWGLDKHILAVVISDSILNDSDMWIINFGIKGGLKCVSQPKCPKHITTICILLMLISFSPCTIWRKCNINNRDKGHITPETALCFSLNILDKIYIKYTSIFILSCKIPRVYKHIIPCVYKHIIDEYFDAGALQKVLF